MIGSIPDGFEYVEKRVVTEKNPLPHWVVRTANTPPDALKILRKYDLSYFKHTGRHILEFIEE